MLSVGLLFKFFWLVAGPSDPLKHSSNLLDQLVPTRRFIPAVVFICILASTAGCLCWLRRLSGHQPIGQAAHVACGRRGRRCNRPSATASAAVRRDPFSCVVAEFCFDADPMLPIVVVGSRVFKLEAGAAATWCGPVCARRRSAVIILFFRFDTPLASGGATHFGSRRLLLLLPPVDAELHSSKILLASSQPMLMMTLFPEIIKTFFFCQLSPFCVSVVYSLFYISKKEIPKVCVLCAKTAIFFHSTLQLFLMTEFRDTFSSDPQRRRRAKVNSPFLTAAAAAKTLRPPAVSPLSKKALVVYYNNALTRGIYFTLLINARTMQFLHADIISHQACPYFKNGGYHVKAEGILSLLSICLMIHPNMSLLRNV